MGRSSRRPPNIRLELTNPVSTFFRRDVEELNCALVRIVVSGKLYPVIESGRTLLENNTQFLYDSNFTSALVLAPQYGESNSVIRGHSIRDTFLADFRPPPHVVTFSDIVFMLLVLLEAKKSC